MHNPPTFVREHEKYIPNPKPIVGTVKKSTDTRLLM
jgi:hypothetical protein